jgi:gamma-glutamylcyclotransferase (GGCT)/AIG2-like uncharacterized protein YtfP
VAEAVFVYGTLLLPEVIEAVTGRAGAARPARLAGFARRRLAGRSFPGLVADPRAEVRGALHEGLDAAALAALDRFEGELYERVRVRVELEDGGGASAWTYTLSPLGRPLVTGDAWDLADFAARDLDAFLAGCRAFRAGLGPGPAAGG